MGTGSLRIRYGLAKPAGLFTIALIGTVAGWCVVALERKAPPVHDPAPKASQLAASDTSSFDDMLPRAYALLREAKAIPWEQGGMAGRLYDEEREAFYVANADGRADPDVHILLSECGMGQGYYDSVVLDTEHLLAYAPGYPPAVRILAEAGQRLSVAQAARRELPPTHEVLQVESLGIRQRCHFWVVLSARTRTLDEWNTPPVGLSLSLLDSDPDGCRLWWRSSPLDSAHAQGGSTPEAYLFVRDLTADGVPEIVLQQSSGAASCAPSHLDIFAWRGPRLERALAVSGTDVPILPDLDGDGRREVVNTYEIGSSIVMCHAAMPRWSDLYRWENGRYKLADGALPVRVRTGLAELLSRNAPYSDGPTLDTPTETLPTMMAEAVRQFPGCPELCTYLGLAKEWWGSPREAIRAYRAAISLTKPSWEAASAPGTGRRDRAFARRRLASLERRNGADL